jgi:ribose transport system permease protein
MRQAAPEVLVGLWKNYRIWFVLVLLMVIATLISGGIFIRGSNLINILFTATPIAIAAIGQTFVILTGGIDLSVAAVWVVASVTGASLAVSGQSVAVCIIVAVAIGVIMGLVNGLIIAYLRIPAMIATLGMLSVGEGLARIYRGNQPILSMPTAYNSLGSAYFGPVPFPILVLLVILLAAIFFSSRTVVGKEIYAVGGNMAAAEYSGLRVRFALCVCYALSGALAAIAGILQSTYINLAVPNVNSSTQFSVIAAVVVGGTKMIGGEGTVINTIAGVLVILTIENVMNILGISPLAEEGVLGLVTLIAVYLNVGLRGSAGREKTLQKGV